MSRAESLATRLATLAEHEGDAPYLRVHARAAHVLNAVRMDGAGIAMPLQGRKRVRDHGGEWLDVARGELLLIPHARTFDVENFPDPAREEPYLAVCIALPPNVLDAARQLLPDAIYARGDGIAVEPIDGFVSALGAWCDAIGAADETAARYALVGVALELCARGHVALLKPTAPTLAQRVRGLVATEPAREWSSNLIESSLGMSGATLRRRLAGEGTSLREIVADARLACALVLLQSTTLPLKSVAHRVGYASLSSFSKRFGARYGIEPSRVTAA